MKNPESRTLSVTLKKEGVHQKWENAYRTSENEEFYEKAFDYIVSVLNAPKDSTFLDVGCGIGAHSIRLARRGFSVLGTDFSETVLTWAEKNIRDRGMKDRIRLQREDILSSSFEDACFDYILCWGVLMHIHDIERGISEIARILKPGGRLVISEVNMNSLQSVILRTLKRLLGKENALVKKTPAGLEYWTITPSGRLLTRETDIQWLKNKSRQNGLVVKKHIPGQFTELYTRIFFGPLIKFVHLFNTFWFKHIRLPNYAFGNIIIFQKEDNIEG